MAWQAADGTKRRTRIAWLAVYVLSDLNQDTGAWPQTWLMVDWPEADTEPCHIYLAWLKTEPVPLRCLRLSRGRFAVEQFFQRDQTDLGLAVRGPVLAWLSSPLGAGGRSLSVRAGDLPAQQENPLVLRGRRYCTRCSPGW